MMKWKSVFKNTWLCLKYPFLYPRNRFSGKHYTNWKLIEKIKSHASKATFFCSIKVSKDEPEGPLRFYRYLDGENETIYIRVNHPGTTLTFVKGKLGSKSEKVVYEFDLGVEIVSAGWEDKNLRVTINKDAPEDHKKTWFVSFVINSKENMIVNFLSWIHDYPLQILHCLPSHTELDAMEKGWRKRFGEDFCRDLKKAIVSTCGYKALWSPWIMQIKEKWGALEVYLVGYNEEIYEVVSKYHNLSKKVCIVCGKDAEWISRGWISPYCSEHIGDTSNADPC